MKEAVAHVWKVSSEETPEGVLHLAMGETGAVQAYLLHHGMAGYNGALNAEDLGPVTHRTERGEICFEPECVLYGLSFPQEPGEGP